MESYTIKNLTFKYPASGECALNGISLSVEKGEFITVCGHSGSGKSTFLRMLKPLLSPNGERRGEILFDGKEVLSLEAEDQVRKIGFVIQSPDSQIVTDKVWHELAFGLESLGVKNPEIRARVAEMASFFGIEEWFHKKTTDLSGGQKQLLNLASVMVMQPTVLILDEPTSQLDPIAAQTFLEAVSKINRELGVTVILSEHRLEDALAMSDKLVVMEKGQILYCGKPENVVKTLSNSKSTMLQAMPAAMRIYAALDGRGSSPVTVREGREFLGEYAEKYSFETANPTPEKNNGEVILKVEDVFFKYEKNLPDAVKSLNMTVKKGEFYAILGGNGSGKTTTLSMICGINKPYRGKISIKEENTVIGLLPQNPQTLFVEKTVEKDIYEMLLDLNISKDEKENLFNEIVSLCNLESLLDRHPYDLSGGEMQRAALAKILLRKPTLLLLDEPTKGMDAGFKNVLADILKSLQTQGTTIIMVSHDVEFCAKNADRCAMFFDGGIVSEGTPREFFTGKSFYTTAANRISRGIIDGAVTVGHILEAFRKKEKTVREKKIIKNIKKESPKEKPEKKKKAINKITVLLSIITVLIIMPLTAAAGIYLLDDKKYYFISMLLIIEAMIPFIFSFEKRKALSKAIVVISSLCAIAVAGRIAFFMVPFFKPLATVVIITGICFGMEAGFLTGAVSAFVSNFYFGQGPWTPWQMFGMASVGFFAGLLFSKGILKKTRVTLCIFGMAIIMLIYGPIVDLSALSTVKNPTLAYMLAVWGLGMPFNLIHAVSTAFFLFTCAPVMTEKLERIKIKYGILD